MTSRRILLAALLLAVATATFASTSDFIIPASGSGTGDLGSRWQSEVTLYNAAPSQMALTLSFHDATGQVGSFPLTLAAKSTTSINDIVFSRFGLASAVGAIVIDVTDDGLAEQLAVSSRTFNSSATGEFGQDIPAYAPGQSLSSGYSGIIAGPSNATAVRLNFGLYAVKDSTIEWSLIRRDGTVAKTVTKSYAAGRQTQYSRGVSALFDSVAADNDVVQADVISGEVVLYGSAVNNQTGDPTFVPSSRIRETAAVEFLGIDLDEDGSVDIQAHDGVLDRPLYLSTNGFPSFFRVVAREASGKPLTFTIANGTRDVAMADSANGLLQWVPGADSKGTSSSVTVRVSDGVHTADLIIPAVFR